MPRLTEDQLIKLQEISNNPGITQASVDWRKGNAHIVVIANPNSKLLEVSTKLSEIFPGIEIRDSYADTYQDKNNFLCELYSLKTPEGVPVALQIRSSEEIKEAETV